MPVLKHKRDPRVEKFLKHFAETNNISQSAQRAGYTKSYATKRGKQLLESALKYSIRKASNTLSDPNTTSEDIHNALHTLIGMSGQETGEEYLKIVKQDRDISTKFKALIPLLREEGINVLDTDRQNQVVPVMNITVRHTDSNESSTTNPHVRDITPTVDTRE